MSQSRRVSVISLSANPVDMSYKEERGKDWVTFGENNSFFDQLLEMYNSSNQHRSIIQGLSDRYSGRGLALNATNFNLEAEIRSLFPKRILDRIAIDVALFKRYAVLVRTNKAGTKIVEVEHYPVSTLRPDKIKDGRINGYWYAEDWKEVQKKKVEPEYIPCFDSEYSRQVGEFIFMIKAYEPDGNPYMNKPTYNGCLNWINADIEISKYHLTNIEHGFSGTLAIKFANTPDDTERGEIERAVRSRLTGSTGDKVVFLYGTENERPEFDAIDVPDADKKYEVLDKMIEQKIVIGHRITSPMLLGIKSNTGLGNNADEIKTANELLENTSVNPVHNFILSGIREIFSWNGYSNQMTDSIIIQPLKLINEDTTSKPQTTKMNADVKVIDSVDENFLLSYFSDKGEDENKLLDAGFTLFEAEDLFGDDELKVKNGSEKLSIQFPRNVNEKLSDPIKTFLSDWGVTPGNLSRYDVKAPDGSGVWLVRYQYALASSEKPPAIKSNTRQFCRDMIDAARNGNRVYKREVLSKLSNPEFGGYNIFWYKGSYNCRHVWKRKLYFRPNDWKPGQKVKRVGNVPYVVSKVNDKRATTVNKKTS